MTTKSVDLNRQKSRILKILSKCFSSTKSLKIQELVDQYEKKYGRIDIFGSENIEVFISNLLNKNTSEYVSYGQFIYVFGFEPVQLRNNQLEKELQCIKLNVEHIVSKSPKGISVDKLFTKLCDIMGTKLDLSQFSCHSMKELLTLSKSELRYRNDLVLSKHLTLKDSIKDFILAFANKAADWIKLYPSGRISSVNFGQEFLSENPEELETFFQEQTMVSTYLRMNHYSKTLDEFLQNAAFWEDFFTEIFYRGIFIRVRVNHLNFEVNDSYLCYNFDQVEPSSSGWKSEQLASTELRQDYFLDPKYPIDFAKVDIIELEGETKGPFPRHNLLGSGGFGR